MLRRCLFVGAVIAGAGVVLGHLHRAGREKLVDREVHVAEQAAGIFLIAAVALRLGDTVVVDGNQQLRVALQTYQRKLTQCYIVAALAAVVHDQFLIKAAADAGRQLCDAGLAAATAGGTAIHDAGIQYDGVHSLHHSNGQIALCGIGRIHSLHHSIGTEDLGAALTAKENTAFIKDAQTFGLGIARCTSAYLQCDAIEKAHIYGVEAAVKIDRLYIGIDVQKFCSATFDHLAAIEDGLPRAGGVEAKILNAVLITTAVKNLSRMNTHGFPNATQVADRARHSFFSHRITS